MPHPPSSLAPLLAAAISLSACPPLAARQSAPFTEEALQRGIDFTTPSGPSAARGVALVDLNNDSFPDLVIIGGVNNVVGVWQNDGAGHFISRTATSGIPAFSNASGLVAADYDADGDLDLYLSRQGSTNALLRNDGDFHFTDVALAAGVRNGAGATMGCTWGDFDADGWPDLYVSNFTNIVQPARNALYRNNHDGTFTDVAPQFGAADVGYTWQSVFFDFDRDTRPDLYVSNDKGYDPPRCSRRNFLFHNTGAALADVTYASGTAACVESMGIAIGDFDGNRLPDIYITNTLLGHELYLNQGDGVFNEVGLEWGVRSFSVGWGAAFVDLDNDARLDLYVCNYDAPNRLYVRGPERCADMADAMGIALPGPSKQVVCIADIDNDGDLDFILQCANDRVRLFINHEGERRHWAKFRVVGRHPNTFALGASVDIRTGDTWQTREILGAGGFKCSDDPTLHFGLDTATTIDEIIVRWPHSAPSSFRTLRNYPADQTWALYPDELLGHAAATPGPLTTRDFYAFLDCFFNSDGPVTPGCEMMDMNSDGLFTSTDFFTFLARFFN